MCLGVAVVENDDGTKVGVNAKPCNYSGKQIIAIVEMKRKKNAEINQIRNLKHGGKNWVIDKRIPCTSYEVDLVLFLKNLGASYSQKLERSGITTVSDLKQLLMENFLMIVQNEDSNLRIPHKTLYDFVTQAKNSLPGLIPGMYDQFAQASKRELLTDPCVSSDIIDYRKSENPYEAEYGKDAWYAKIRALSLLSPFICISEMVNHIVVELARIYKGTKHEDDWMFYHDALSLTFSQVNCFRAIQRATCSPQ
jgi:hypothetical protein